MTRTLSLSCLLVAALLAAGEGAARAERGVVLGVDKHDVYVDLGTDQHVLAGSELELYHAIVATHPVTRRKVRDTFPLGRLTVVKAGRRVSVARAPADIRARVAPGDEVELATPARTYQDPWRAQPSEPAAGAEADADGAEEAEAPSPPAGPTAEERAAATAHVTEENAVRETWQRTLGKPPEDRVTLWLEFLRYYPDSPHASAIKAEIGSLRAQVEAERLAAEAAVEAQSPQARADLAFERLEQVTPMFRGGPLAYQAPVRVYQGSPFEIAFLVTRPGAVRSAWVHYRRAGEQTYRRAAMALGGDGFLRQRIPGSAVRPPAVEYFVSVQDEEGDEPEPVIGSAYGPERVRVDASVEEPPRDIAGRSRISLWSDYVDFDSRNSWDYYWTLEADFMYRFRKPVYAMRVGFGTMWGVGGERERLNRLQDAGYAFCTEGGLDPRRNPDVVSYCRKVGWNYAYTEVEMRFTDIFGVMVRPMIGGARRDPNPTISSGREYYTAEGLKLRLRLGRETATNLAVGVALAEGLGTLYEAAFTWDVIPPFPIKLTAQVTDQPVVQTHDDVVGANYGVRLIADVGWRGLGWLYPSARISYQARDIDHAGVSGGAAVNFDW